MVHLSYVPVLPHSPESSGRFRSDTQLPLHLKSFGKSPEIHGGGGTTTLGPRTRNIASRLRRRHADDDERGAELIEFALVVVLLITLLYGIITYGLILGAQATITQAAADAARSGIVSSSTSVATAEAQACTDVGWMNKTCGNPVTFNTSNCTFSPNPADAITAFACTEPCPSNSGNSVNTCLAVTVSYNYSATPLFPELPGLGVITPSTISSTNVLQLSTPSS
jgi:Flp pilus assembly protein TadG